MDESLQGCTERRPPLAQPAAGKRTLSADEGALVRRAAELHGDSDSGISGVRQPGDAEANGPLDSLAPSSKELPLRPMGTYRIDSAGHQVPYGEP